MKNNNQELANLDSVDMLAKTKALLLDTISEIGEDAIKYAPPELWSDRDFIFQLLGLVVYHDFFEQVDDKLKQDREFNLQAVQVNPRIFPYINANFRNDPEIAMAALAIYCQITCWRIFNALSGELQNSRTFTIQALNKNPHLVTVINTVFLDDDEIATLVLQKCGNYLELFSSRIKQDYSLVRLAVSNYGLALLAAAEALQNNYDLVLIAAQKNGEIIRYLDRKYCDDETIILAALVNKETSLVSTAKNFCFASARLKSDRAFVVKAISLNGYIYPFINSAFQDDYAIICSAAKTFDDIMIYLNDQLREDKTIVFNSLISNVMDKQERLSPLYTSDAFKFNHSFRNDRDFIITAIKAGARILKYATTEIRNDREIVKLAIQNSGSELIYASEQLRNEKELCLLALQNDLFILEYLWHDFINEPECQVIFEEHGILHNIQNQAVIDDIASHLQKIKQNSDEYTFIPFFSERLRNDQLAVIESLMDGHDELFCRSSRLIRDDYNIVLLALKVAGKNLRHTNDHLRNDLDILDAAVNKSAKAIYYANEEHQDNPYLIRQIISSANYDYALEFASRRLRSDYEIVVEAVQKNGFNLFYACDELRNCPEIINSALQTTPAIFRWLPSAVRNDRELILKYLNKHWQGDFLIYLNDELRDDKIIVRLAMEKIGVNILEYASLTIRQDSELMLEALTLDDSAVKFIDKRLLSNPEFKNKCAQLTNNQTAR